MKRTRKSKAHKGRRRFGDKSNVDLWAVRLVGENLSWRSARVVLGASDGLTPENEKPTMLA